MSGYKLITTVVFSNVTEVRFYDETIRHVLEAHEEVPLELPSLQLAVVNAIIKPSYIEEGYGQSYVFVDETSTNWSGDPLRVPVKMVQSTFGRIRTAYFATTTAKNIAWKRSDDE